MARSPPRSDNKKGIFGVDPKMPKNRPLTLYQCTKGICHLWSLASPFCAIPQSSYQCEQTILEKSKMKNYLITYDLSPPGQDYTNLIEAIKQTGVNWAHPQLSVWIVKSSFTAVSIRDGLLRYLDQNDKLLVSELGSEAAWSNLGQELSNWLRGNLAA